VPELEETSFSTLQHGLLPQCSFKIANNFKFKGGNHKEIAIDITPNAYQFVKPISWREEWLQLSMNQASSIINMIIHQN